MKFTSIFKVLMLSASALLLTFSAAAQGSCDAFVQQALNMMANNCNTIPINSACYGYFGVNATFTVPVTFAQPADQAEIASFQNLTTQAYDPNANVWGIAVLKLQANIPNTLPGQAVTMVLLGDAQLASGAAGSTAFTVNTGIGQPSCQQIPPSSITVQGPQGIHVNLNVNGADIGFASTINIRQTSEDEMEVSTIDGRATIDDEIIIPAGFQRTAQLGSDGLVVEDSWSEPEVLSEEDVAELELLEQLPEDIFDYPVDAPEEDEIAFLDALGFDLVAEIDPHLLDVLIADFQLGGIAPEDLEGATTDDLYGYVLANLDYFEPDEAFLAAMAQSFNIDDSQLADLADYYDLDMDLIDAISTGDYETMFNDGFFATEDSSDESQVDPVTGEDTIGEDTTVSPSDDGTGEDTSGEAPAEPPVDVGGGEGDAGGDGG